MGRRLCLACAVGRDNANPIETLVSLATRFCCLFCLLSKQIRGSVKEVITDSTVCNLGKLHQNKSKGAGSLHSLTDPRVSDV